ncbi:MAG: YfiR family protein [Azoarcus sp.]|jgi:hypothetical protein|nr:YfiR family protein [Azoarcus sp.]
MKTLITPNLTRKLLHCLLPVLCGLVVFASPGYARPENGAAPAYTSKVVTVIWGIISYTRWPGERESLRICLPSGHARAAAIRESAKVIDLGQKIVVRSMPPDAASACDVVYFPTMADDETSRLLKNLIGAPVLTIGEGGAFCTMGGMFCLLSGDDAKDGGVKFAANLDATSRSSLRISPQVLKLSKRRRERQP